MANNNINRSLTGIDPLAYMGINASGSTSASQTVVQYRAPTINDSKNFIIGCFWLWPDTTSPAHSAQIWMLTALIGNLATWTLIQDSATGEIVTIQGDTGFITGPTVSIKGAATAGSTVSFDGDNATAMTFSVTDSNVNTILGRSSGNPTITGTSNTGLGLQVFTTLSSGISNTAIGLNAGRFVTSGQTNTFVGRGSGGAITTSNDNTCIGAFAGLSVVTGANNILIGRSAGSTYVGAESNNIVMGNTAVIGDSGKIRIGTNGTQTATFIAGIDGVDLNTVTVVTESSDQLGTAVLTAGAGITITHPAPNNITITNSGTSSISITGDSGGALTGNSFTFTGGTTGLTFAGAGTTETLGGTLAIANGGTNATSFATTDGTVYFDGTRLVTTATGTAGQVLTSNGAGLAPSYQAAGSGTTFFTGGITSTSTSNVVYMYPGGNGTTTATLASGQMVIPQNGTFDRLYINVVQNANTATTTWTLNVNGVDSTVTASIGATTTGVASDLVHTKAVSQGDLITFTINQATTSNAVVIPSIRFTPS